MITLKWAALRHARLEHDLQYDVDFFGSVGDLAEFIVKAVATTAIGGPVGLIVFLGLEAIDALDLQ